MVVSSSWVLFKSIETHSQPRELFKKPCSGFFTADVMSAWYFLNTKIWTPDVCNWASLCLRWSRSDLVAHGSIMSSCIVYSGDGQNENSLFFIQITWQASPNLFFASCSVAIPDILKIVIAHTTFIINLTMINIWLTSSLGRGTTTNLEKVRSEPKGETWPHCDYCWEIRPHIQNYKTHFMTDKNKTRSPPPSDILRPLRPCSWSRPGCSVLPSHVLGHVWGWIGWIRCDGVLPWLTWQINFMKVKILLHLELTSSSPSLVQITSGRGFPMKWTSNFAVSVSPTCDTTIINNSHNVHEVICELIKHENIDNQDLMNWVSKTGNQIFIAPFGI